jgi:hypothetical protein
MKIVLALFAIATTAAEPAQVFLTAYKNLKFEGLPNKSQLKRLSPHLSAELQNAIKGAQAVQAHCMKKFPDEKPMWIEGFTSFKVASSNRAKAIIEFEYIENGQKVAWKDELVFAEEKGKLVIDDVRYGRSEGFTSGFGNSLKKSLTSGTSCE